MESFSRMKKVKNDFSHVDLPIMLYNSSKENKYKVYSNATDFKIIVAENASNAIEKSEINAAYKIEDIVEDLIYIIDKSDLTEQNSEK